MWTIEHARSSDSDLCASSWSPDDDDKHGNNYGKGNNNRSSVVAINQ